MNDCQPDIILAPYSGISEDEYNKLSETTPVVQTCSRFATKVQSADSSDARVSSQDSRRCSRWCRGGDELRRQVCGDLRAAGAVWVTHVDVPSGFDEAVPGLEGHAYRLEDPVWYSSGVWAVRYLMAESFSLS